MAAGEQRAMDASASVFAFGAGASSQADVEVLGDEGDAEACKASQKDAKENERCAVPLRVGLAALDAPAAPDCPEGSVLQGDKCVRKNVVTQVECPAGTKWDGSKCAASVDTTCANGLHFVQGRGCVADVAAAPAPARPGVQDHCRPLGTIDCEGLGYQILSRHGDEQEAFRYFQQSCSAGARGGCMWLGLCYRDGRGVAANPAQAVTFLQRGCDAGQGDSCKELGYMYEGGRGIAANRDTALQLFDKGCRAGSTNNSACADAQRLRASGGTCDCLPWESVDFSFHEGNVTTCRGGKDCARHYGLQGNACADPAGAERGKLWCYVRRECAQARASTMAGLYWRWCQ